MATHLSSDYRLSQVFDPKEPTHVSRCSQQIYSPTDPSPEPSPPEASVSKLHFWDVNSPSFRFFALILATLIPFGGHVVKSSVASIAPLMVDDKEFGLTHTELGSFQSIVSLPNLIVPILGGLWLDVKGSRYGTLVAVILCTLGQCLFAFGCSIHSYPLALCARFIFGLGQGSTVVAQGRLAAKWFMGRELIFAIAITESLHNAAGFIGSALSAQIATTFQFGYIGALYMGTLFCGVSALSGITLFLILPDNDIGSHSPLENTNTDSLADNNVVAPDDNDITIVDHGADDDDSETHSCMDFRKFSMGFITLCVLHMIFSNTYHLFGFVVTSIMNSEWSYSVNASSLLGALQYALAIVLCPVLGFVLDRYKTSTMMFCVFAGLISSVCYLSLAFHMINPLLPLLVLACCISFVPTVLRASVPLYVSANLYGAGYGCYEISESIGAVFGHVLVGYTRDATHSYTESLQLFAVLAALASFISMALHIMMKRSSSSSPMSIKLVSEDGIEYKPMIMAMATKHDRRTSVKMLQRWSVTQINNNHSNNNNEVDSVSKLLGNNSHHRHHSSINTTHNNSSNRSSINTNNICPETPVNLPSTPYYGSVNEE